MIAGSYAQPDLAAETRNFFDRFYRARTLPRGGKFDLAGLRGLVEGPYADYTLPLFEREVRDADTGALQEVTFTGIDVVVQVVIPGDNLAARVQAGVTRTRVEVRAGSTPTRDTATYQFLLRRYRVGSDGVAWAAYDFKNPATSEWVSSAQVSSDSQIAKELTAFFTKFYEARSFAPGRPLELGRTLGIVDGSYAAYTLPLLAQTKADETSGAVTEVRYVDLSVQVEKWDPNATSHGGDATVAITRTALVFRPSGPDAPQAATYEFRAHRHVDDLGNPFWIAIDFLRPDLNRWVSDLAGATVSVPPTGHG